jgi:hypothetical protein
MLLFGVRTFLPRQGADDKAVCGAKIRIMGYELKTDTLFAIRNE